MRRRVAITGMGAVTPVGNDVPTTWASLTAGRSGIGPITTFPADTFPVRIAGQVKNFELRLPDGDGSRRLRRHLSRAAGFGVGAALEALAQADVNRASYAPERRGVAMGGSVGRAELRDLAEMSYRIRKSDSRDFMRQSPASVVERDQNIGAATIALLADCRGPLIGVSTACAGSAHAVGEAFRRIQDGDADLMVAGAYDALTTWLDVIGFSLLGALTTAYNDNPQRASRPFERDRSGFVLAEGAAVLVLEEWEAATARGAPLLAEIAGFGSSLNAYRITDAPPDGKGASLAIRNALADAGVPKEEIDYVAAHGTSTPGNDLCETVALKAVFGQDAYRLAISSNKSMTGHLTNAAGALNIVASVCAMRDEIVPPTINFEHPDPKLDLDYVPNQARQLSVRAALVNAFAFGGTNASLVLRRSTAGAAAAS